jgi:hypothetical protein
MRADLAFRSFSIVAALAVAAPAAAQTAPAPEVAMPPPQAAAAEASTSPVAPAEAPAVAVPPPSPPPPARPTPAPTPRPQAFDPTAHAHDGLYLQLQLGGGSTSLHFDGSSQEAGGGLLNIAAGGAVAPNLILFGTLFGTQLAYTISGVVGGNTITPYDVNATVGGLGAGVAYCFMPSNACLTGMLGVASVTFKFKGTRPDGTINGQETTNHAAAFKAAITKEWWLSNQLALGVGAQLLATGSMDEKTAAGGSVRATSYGLVASLTFN